MKYRASIVYGNIDYYLSYENITAFEYLGFMRNYGALPNSREGAREVSNSELRRWLEKGSVIINGKTPHTDDVIEFPIKELVFFKGAKTQCTML